MPLRLRIGRSKAGLIKDRFRVIKDIKPGTQCTYHYGRDYFDSFIKAVGCKCVACGGSKPSGAARPSGEANGARSGRLTA
jgi:hypothetical protein